MSKKSIMVYYSEFTPDPNCTCSPCEARRNKPPEPPVDCKCTQCGQSVSVKRNYDSVPIWNRTCEEVRKKQLEQEKKEELLKCKKCGQLPPNYIRSLTIYHC